MEGVADHAYACADGLGHMGALVTYLSLYLGSCTTKPSSEKTEMARTLMLVVSASLLSLGKLSVLVNQVLASIQF